jgi:hypothetical protein
VPDQLEYRAYLIGQDGHVQQRFDLTATDEAVAREQAKQLVDGHAIELWQLARKIATFEPEK